jgi:phosphoketolase
MEMLSEHTVKGWLEGYLLTGRHGFLSSYEAFVDVIDSMFNQHAMVGKMQRATLARRCRFAEPADYVYRVAAGSQWFHRPRS